MDPEIVHLIPVSSKTKSVWHEMYLGKKTFLGNQRISMMIDGRCGCQSMSNDLKNEMLIHCNQVCVTLTLLTDKARSH